MEMVLSGVIILTAGMVRAGSPAVRIGEGVVGRCEQPQLQVMVMEQRSITLRHQVVRRSEMVSPLRHLIEVGRWLLSEMYFQNNNYFFDSNRHYLLDLVRRMC